MIDNYYQSKAARKDIEDERTEEADKVSARITEILSEKSFSFTPDYLILIHRRLFEGLYKFAGKLRDYDITKKEWVLDGDTVLYSSHELIRQTLEYDFGLEKSVNYPSLDAGQALMHICKFVSDIWQVHPFGEGNTRATAVFTMKYLHTFGFTFATTSFLELFFRNLLFGEKNGLHTRDLHIAAPQSANTHNSKSQNGSLNCTLDEIALLKFLKDNPEATQTEIAAHIGKSPRTVKRMTPSLIERGLLERENGKRNGKWVVKD